MNTAARPQAGGIATTLVVALFLAVAIGLYLQIVMNDDAPPVDPVQVSESTASVQVLEGDESGPAGATSTAAQPLPDDQMATIRRVFAPETTN